MIEPLVDALRSHQVILFMGAGVSMNLGLPSWTQLIAEMGKRLEFDPLVFEGHGSFLELAEYYQIKKTSLGSLRSWMDRTWHQNEERLDASDVHQAIVDLRCPIMYTTNYDRWLEIAFDRRGERYVKIANVGDFTRISDGVRQIVKLHGDFEDDASLVLTETSYFERLSFESPLDIKLRSDSIGRTILFIGYSLSDINVRYLLYKLHCMWSNSAYSASRPKSYMFLTRPNPVQEAILDKRGILPVVSEHDDPTKGLSAFLKQLVHEAFGTTRPSAPIRS
jgi:hypothetical protein